VRGTAAGEPIVSQAQTQAFDEGYDRTFGEPSKERGRFVWDEAQGRLVRAEDYHAPERALDAPIMMDRFYENTCATDGVDIGSRRKHRQYMRERGLTTVDDYKETFAKKAAEREAAKEGRVPSKTRRETLARAMYQIDNRK
jgi:hypothetical protein